MSWSALKILRPPMSVIFPIWEVAGLKISPSFPSSSLACCLAEVEVENLLAMEKRDLFLTMDTITAELTEIMKELIARNIVKG